MKKILLTLAGKMIAPRFDKTTEVMIAPVLDGEISAQPRFILLPGPSADELCGLILKENVDHLICGGIEDEHYQFLSWKKIQVIDRVIGRYQDVLDCFLRGELRANGVIRNSPESDGKEAEGEK